MLNQEIASITLRVQSSHQYTYLPNLETCERKIPFFNHAPTQEEVDLALRKELDAVNSLRWSDLKSASLLVRKLLNPSIDVTVTGHNINAKELEKAVRRVSRKNANIQSASISDRTSDEDPLIAKLKSIIDERNKENLRRTNKMRTSIIVNILFAAYLSFGATALAMGFSIAMNVLTGWSITRLRQWYLDSAANRFKKKKQINAVPDNDHRVITALEKGARSAKWGHYFLSHFSYSAWRHPRVFAAGMELAIEEKASHIELIHQKYAARVPIISFTIRGPW